MYTRRRRPCHAELRHRSWHMATVTKHYWSYAIDAFATRNNKTTRTTKRPETLWRKVRIRKKNPPLINMQPRDHSRPGSRRKLNSKHRGDARLCPTIFRWFFFFQVQSGQRLSGKTTMDLGLHRTMTPYPGTSGATIQKITSRR